MFPRSPIVSIMPGRTMIMYSSPMNLRIRAAARIAGQHGLTAPPTAKTVGGVSSYDELPGDLPIPVDDGAAEHLIGSAIPALRLPATSGHDVAIHELPGRTVLFVYPRTGTPGKALPTGWDGIPGARGCTPQACGIRDSHEEFVDLDARVFGLSTQSAADQLEASRRLQLPYPLLSDSDLTLTQAWELPTFCVDGLTLIRRITIFLMDGTVDGIIYPVFPPDKSAQSALAWLGNLQATDSPTRPRPDRRPPIPPRRGMPHPIPPRLVR